MRANVSTINGLTSFTLTGFVWQGECKGSEERMFFTCLGEDGLQLDFDIISIFSSSVPLYILVASWTRMLVRVVIRLKIFDYCRKRPEGVMVWKSLKGWTAVYVPIETSVVVRAFCRATDPEKRQPWLAVVSIWSSVTVRLGLRTVTLKSWMVFFVNILWSSSVLKRYLY